jgi:hypothetical protein
MRSSGITFAEDEEAEMERRQSEADSCSHQKLGFAYSSSVRGSNRTSATSAISEMSSFGDSPTSGGKHNRNNFYDEDLDNSKQMSYRQRNQALRDMRLAAAAQLPQSALVGEDGKHHHHERKPHRNGSISSKSGDPTSPSEKPSSRRSSFSVPSNLVASLFGEGAEKHNSNGTADDAPPQNQSSADELLASIDGMPGGTINEKLTQEEVTQEAEKHKSHHMRSVDYSHRLVVMLNRDPVVHEEPHRETFFELFYDLIMVVVFIKLSFLKYNLSAEGLFAVFAFFANFWSCWSLLNTCEFAVAVQGVLASVSSLKPF